MMWVVEVSLALRATGERANPIAPDDTLQAQVTHQPLHCVTRNVEALAVHLPPDFALPVNAKSFRQRRVAAQASDPDHAGLDLITA